MKTVIKPETINILCEDFQNKDNINENPTPNSENKIKYSKWEKIKAGINEVCMAIQPMIAIIIPVCKAVSMVLRACASYRKSGKRCGRRQWATC